MNKRENMLRALRRDNPESVPFDFELCPSQIENFERLCHNKQLINSHFYRGVSPIKLLTLEFYVYRKSMNWKNLHYP